ncbi:MAG: hypothetical protein ACTILC_10355, partial [Oceanisphaera sp.]
RIHSTKKKPDTHVSGFFIVCCIKHTPPPRVDLVHGMALRAISRLKRTTTFADNATIGADLILYQSGKLADQVLWFL